MQRGGLTIKVTIKDRDKMRANDCLNQITFGAIQNVANDNEICIRFLSEKSIRNSTLDSKLGKLAKQLYLQDHPDYVFQTQHKYANGQVLHANVWKETMKPYLDRALEHIIPAIHKN